MSGNSAATPLAANLTLHFECFAGISGDMALGALVDLGVDREALVTELLKLNVPGWKLEFVPDERGGIYGTHALVTMTDGSVDHIVHDEHHHHVSNNAHEYNHSHDNGHTHDHEESHDDSEHHDHEHDHVDKKIHDDSEYHYDSKHRHDQVDKIRHDNNEHYHNHEHRRWRDIKSLIESSSITEGAKTLAIKIFTCLAEAEAKVHGTTPDEVAFHEVGAVDSIIDIVGTAVCLDMLKPARITCGTVELGGGLVRCAHGLLPVPAPAVLELCAETPGRPAMPVKTGGFDKEMTTPTGAAILRASVDEFSGDYAFTHIKHGIGIGTRKMGPNFLRVSLRNETAASPSGAPNSRGGLPPYGMETIIEIKANIDDMTGEDFGYAQKCLFDAGALDVALVPCGMKKSRPGNIIIALVKADKLLAVRETLFKKTTTIGIREIEMRRLFLRREEGEGIVDGKSVRTKKVFYGDEFLREKLEYEDRIKA
jgi:uncharacterized protein (TIGR00299 family) protein